MLLKSEHSLGVDGIGPRTFLDSYEISLFDFQVMSEIVAELLSDFDHVDECFMFRYREAREMYFAVRAAYLGI